jgi:hypothetical protein
MIWIIAIGWVACSILLYGWSFAYWQKKYPTLAERSYREDLRFSLLMSLGGPIDLIVVLIRRDYVYGFKFI